jgi:glycosyltransferase involved in cell wall biosynthesis
MGAGNCVIAKNTPENREVLGESGLFFDDAESLRQQLEHTLSDSAMVEGLRTRAQARAKARYSWDAVTDAYENLFKEMSALQ